MSVQSGKLILKILTEQFGETIAAVGYDLFRHGSRPVAHIHSTTKLPISEIKHSLCILAKYKLITFTSSAHPDFAEYELLNERVFYIVRYPKYICRIKDKYGDEAEVLLDELLRLGSCTASELIVRCLARVKEQYPSNPCDLVSLRDKFVDMVHGNYLCRCPVPITESSVPSLFLDEAHMFVMPDIDLRELSKMQNGSEGKPGDENVYWVCNFSKFHQDMRDELMISAMTRRIDECAGEVMKCLLQQMYVRTDALEQQSNAIPFVELKQTCAETSEDKYPNIIPFLDQYLKIIVEDSSQFLKKIGDASGGQYVINVALAMEQLAWCCLENYIVQRFSSKSARIFRVVRTHKFIEQELIQKRAMIPDKEAKQLTYELLENHFIKLRVINKGGQQGSIKNFFLFTVDLMESVYVLLDMTEKALLNVMTRRQLSMQENIRLLQKQQRVESLVNTMKIRGDPEEHIKDIEDTLTPADHETIAKAKREMDMLGISEIKLDETLFLLKMYLFYSKKPDTVGKCNCCNYRP